MEKLVDLATIYGSNVDEKAFESRLNTLIEKFEKGEGHKPKLVYSSSGRAEVLGNHTDHNYGIVLVAAITCDILAVVEKTENNTVKVVSDGFPDIIMDLNDTEKKKNEVGGSAALTRGVANKLKEKGEKIGGFTVYCSSTIFNGAGVSSSAAYEVLITEIFNDLYLNGKLTPVEKAIISQYSENVYFEKPSGLLDQSGIAIGALSKLDFKDPTNITIEKVDMIKGYTLIITNTGGDHASLTEHYAAIKGEMGDIAKHFGKTVLREVEYKDFFNELPILKQKYSSRALLRALHFYEENERVELGYQSLKKNDIQGFLKAINESGLSSLNKLQNCAIPGDVNQPVILGIEFSRHIIKNGAIRVHGGGFAGSILAIVKDEESEDYIKEMQRVFGKENVFKASVRGVGAIKIGNLK